MSRVLFYALGGGFGHLTRTRNLVLELTQDQALECVVVCPERSRSVLGEFATCLTIGDIGRTALRSWFVQQLDVFSPDLVVIDTFPRGVLGELELPSKQKRVLVTRWVKPEYYNALPVRQALADFDQICWTEPRSDRHFPGLDCEPITSATPLLSRERARDVLGVDERTTVIGLGSGDVVEQRRTWRRLQEIGDKIGWNICWFSRELGTDHPEVASLLKGADLAVSAAGYNSYYEIARAQVPVLFIPQQRKTDDQTRRAQGRFWSAVGAPTRVYRPGDDLQESLMELLNTEVRLTERREPRGRQQVVEIIKSLL